MLQTVKFAFYILFHPLDGFWDLKHHMKHTFAAANLLLVLLCALQILNVQFTSFHYGMLDRDSNNIFYNIGGFVIPLFAWTVINWALSTLLDGKATMKQIWVQSIFSLFPVLLSMPVLMVLSYYMVLEEAAFFYMIQSVAALWAGFLFLSGNMTIQDYTLGKTLWMVIFTFLGIGAAIFIGIIFFSTFQQLVTFISTVVIEIRYMP